VTFTPFGDLVFGTWFGLGPQAQGEARVAVGILALSAPVLIMRGAAFAQLMLARRTIIITWSTLLRLLSLTGSLAILPIGLQGATIGAGALVLCMAAEAAFAWVFAWRHLLKLPATREPKESLISYWRFAWPLIINQSAELGSIFVINLFLGRLDKSEIAIAAFGVVHGLISLMLAPLRTLAQSAQTLVARREDLRTMFVFAGQLIAAFTVLPLVLFHTPLKHTVLSGIMGLDPELSAYCEPAMGLAFVMALFWSTTALFRGLLARARSTTSLAASGVLRILTASTAGSISLAHPEINGAFLGVAAWILSYAIETAVSTWRLQRLGWYVER
jgi:Na+-driven multidrug efflux pump